MRDLTTLSSDLIYQTVTAAPRPMHLSADRPCLLNGLMPIGGGPGSRG